ncbi:MAG TPA: hypothetical protein VIC84_17545 [Blastocatellia bacterium]|jgi:hypothetical protein
MKLSDIAIAAFFLFSQLPVSVQSLEGVFTKDERLIYQDYEISRSAKPGADSWTITVNKNGKTLSKFEIGATKSNGWANLGLFNFLGGQSKQLIVEGYSGGAHCCMDYRIIDLSPKYRVLYDSNEWRVGSGLTPVDLDKDGVFEFIQSVMTFDYFYVSHARSPFPKAIFKYDLKTGKYLPANNLFPDEVAQDLDKDMAEVAQFKQDPEGSDAYEREEYVAAALRTLLKYVYSGREPQAWAFFDAEYKLDDKQKLRSDVKKLLRGCAIYNYIYSQRNRNGN